MVPVVPVVPVGVTPGLERHWPSYAQYCQLAQQMAPQAISPEPEGGVQMPPLPVDAAHSLETVLVKVSVSVHVVVYTDQLLPGSLGASVGRDAHPAMLSDVVHSSSSEQQCSFSTPQYVAQMGS